VKLFSAQRRETLQSHCNFWSWKQRSTWQKHKAVISGCEASWRKFNGPKKRRLPEIDDAVFTFFQEKSNNGLFVSYYLLREEAIKKARSLNIPQRCFKASKGWPIRFMHWKGLALRHRTTICQKNCCISNALDGSKDGLVWEDIVDALQVHTARSGLEKP
jgi:hypothetical protein